jgi:transposase
VRSNRVEVERGSRAWFVDAVIYRAKTGVPWRDLPERFGHWKKRL